MSDPRLWGFVADMNFDGSITISDFWLWLKWFYFYPGDGLVYFLLHKTPSIASFFEMTSGSYGGAFSAIVSSIFFVVTIITSIVYFESMDSDDVVGFLFIFGVVVFMVAIIIL